MLRRKIEERLLEWKKSEGHKPLEIRIKDFSSDFVAACNDLLNGKVPLGKGKALADIISYIG